jgi:plasmid stability protein
MPAFIGYTACMINTQYTIRTVPASVDRALRRRAKQEAKSLNAVAVEALARGLELDAKPVEHTDLDALIGSWQEDPAFDRAVADFERVDEDAWK